MRYEKRAVVLVAVSLLLAIGTVGCSVERFRVGTDEKPRIEKRELPPVTEEEGG